METVLDPTRPLIPDLTTIPSESERVQTAQEDERATAREPPRDGPSLPKSSWQAFGESDAPSWKHTRTQKAQYLGNLWVLNCTRKLASAILFIQNHLVSFPRDYPCRTLTKKSCLVMRKTSRPYGKDFLPGWRRTLRPFLGVILSMQEVSIPFPRFTSQKTRSILPRVSI